MSTAAGLRRVVALAAAVALASCGSDGDRGRVDPSARIVELPGAAGVIDFDDIVYSRELGRVLIPARQSGLYLLDPSNSTARRVGRLGSADSADEGAGLVFVLDRDEGTITLLAPEDGRVVRTLNLNAPADYVRYLPDRRELWVTEPAASPSGIEIFALGSGAIPNPRRTGFIEVPNGPEALILAPRRHSAYTHAGSDLVAIDIDQRAVRARWPTRCRGTHGFPRVNGQETHVLASCAHDGEVALLDLGSGRALARHAIGGHEALPAYSPATDHFYVRSDPGTKLATLQPTRRGLDRVATVDVPRDGHCLTADDRGHYWTCDARGGRILQFGDRPAR